MCAKYWPDQGEVMEVGRYVIQNNNETTWSKYFVRRILKVYDTKVVKVRKLATLLPVCYCVLTVD